MLVKKCGFDAVKAVMPEEHMKLLTNIRKVQSWIQFLSFAFVVYIVSFFCFVPDLLMVD